MRILYGVVGEGMGHATRSRVILNHLSRVRGHQIEVVVSGRAHGYLRRAFPELPIHEIAGMNIIYEDNVVKRRKTALAFLKKLPAYAENYDKMGLLHDRFNPELCIADFETFAYLFAKQYDLPVLSIDNMQIINRAAIKEDLDIPPQHRGDFRLTKAIVKSKLPRCDHYLITTFFFPSLRKKRTSLFPPILRPEILEARATATMGEHVLVYQTSDTYGDLLPMLQTMPETRFVVYGYKRDQDLGNVQLRDFSETGFVADLASARAVIAGGGYSLMGEAVYLGKPMLALPLRHQFEQTLNSLYLGKLGYGELCEDLSPERVRAFLASAPRYADNLKAHRQDGNEQLLAALDTLVAEIHQRGRLV